MAKKILLGFLWFFLGMIFGIGALFGTGYLLINNAKLGTITGIFLGDQQDEVISKELQGMKLFDALDELGDSSNTIGDYGQLLPIVKTTLQDALGSEDITKFVTFDFDKLESMKIDELGTGLSSAMSVTASLNALKETFNFTLPDLPLINSTETYIKITDGSFNITNNFYKQSGELSKVYYKEGENYILAYDGTTLKQNATGVDLYYKATGLTNLPINDAITALSTSLNMDEMTIGELETNFGVKLLTDNNGNATVFANLFSVDDKVNEISGLLSTRINDCTLPEFGITINENGLLDKLLTKQNGEQLTVGELINNESLNAQLDGLTLNDLGISLTGLASKILSPSDTLATVKNADVINARINNLKIAEDMGFSLTGLASKVIYQTDTIATLKTNGLLNERINNLEVQDIVDISASESELLKSLANTKIKDLKAKIDGLTVKDVFGASVNGAMADLLYVHDKTTGEVTSTLTLVKNISDEVPYIRLSSVVSGSSNAIVNALVNKGATINNISSTVNDLTLEDAFPQVKIFSEVSYSEINANKRVFSRTGTEGNYVYTVVETPVSGGTYYQIGEKASSGHGAWLIIKFLRSVDGKVYTEKTVKLMNVSYEVEHEDFGAITMMELYEMGYINVKPVNTANMSLGDVLHVVEGKS